MSGIVSELQNYDGMPESLERAHGHTIMSRRLDFRVGRQFVPESEAGRCCCQGR